MEKINIEIRGVSFAITSEQLKGLNDLISTWQVTKREYNNKKEEYENIPVDYHVSFGLKTELSVVRS